MRQPKIIIGQADSLLSPMLDFLIASGDYEIHIVDRGERIMEMSHLGATPDLIVLEANLEHPSAVDLCEIFKHDPTLADTPILIIDPSSSADDTVFVKAGCDDILKGPLQAETIIARCKALIRLKSISEDRDDAEAILHTLARTIEAKDPYTLGHADRVAQYAVELGKQ